MENSQELLSLGQVGKELGITNPGVRNFILKGKLKATKLDVQPKLHGLPDFVYAVTREDLEEFKKNRSSVRRGKK